MGKSWKWLRRLPRPTKKEKHAVTKARADRQLDIEDEVSTMNCESETSKTVLEKIYIQHRVPSHPDGDCGVLGNREEEDEFIESRKANELETESMLRVSPPGISCHEPTDLKTDSSQQTSPRVNIAQSITKHRKKRGANKASQPVESFECIYYEGGVEESRQDSPLVSTSNSLRGDRSPNFCTCSGRRQQLPHLHPSQWPQAPLLLRPKPTGSTRVLGIRKEGTTSCLWEPGQITPWWEVLQNEWDSQSPDRPQDGSNTKTEPESTPHYCEYCVILPINNGCEAEGESLVVDFETPLFEGTLLFRIRGSSGTTKEPYQDTKGYFAGKIIRYQTVLRGRFKTPLVFSNLQTGTRLGRPCGRLPPKWIMWTAMKVIHFFAPQLQTQMENITRPYVLSPLGSAPRTIIVEDKMVDTHNSSGDNMSKELTEPVDSAHSILGRDNPVVNPLDRARARKRQLDQWFMAKSKTPSAQMDKIYTFEFLQHLFDYHSFSIELGSSVHVGVKDILYGQPLQLMAEYHRDGQEIDDPDNNLWAFEIWNECLWKDAQECMRVQH